MWGPGAWTGGRGEGLRTLGSSPGAFVNGSREVGESFSLLLLFVFKTNISSCSEKN